MMTFYQQSGLHQSGKINDEGSDSRYILHDTDSMSSSQPIYAIKNQRGTKKKLPGNQAPQLAHLGHTPQKT